MRRLLAALLALAGAAACERAERKAPPATAIAADTKVMQEANLAAGAVSRALGDCPAVRAALPEALRRLELAEARVQTPAGRTTLSALRAQMRQAAELCPE